MIKALAGIGVVIAGLYVLAAVFLYTMQRSLLYFPTNLATDDGTRNLELTSDSLILKGALLPQGQEHALVYFGGNAESVELGRESLSQQFPRFTIYLLPYRGYSGNPGKPTEAALFTDAIALYDYVAAHHDTVSVMGRSLGSGVATFLAANRAVDKLILVTPFDSIMQVAQQRFTLFPVGILLKDKFDSASRVKNISAETLILIAQNDEFIPASSTQALVREFNPAQLTIKLINHADHNSISNQEGYQQALRDFIAR